MSRTNSHTQNSLVTVDGRTSSIVVAERFGKRHDDVLKRIRALDCPPEYSLRNFAETEVSRPSPLNGAAIKSKAYSMTRDGFALLVMGFTGARAMEWKIKFLDAFNAMEQAIRDGAAAQARSDGDRQDLKAKRIRNQVAHWTTVRDSAQQHLDQLDKEHAGLTNAKSSLIAEDQAVASAVREAGSPISAGQAIEIRAAISARIYSFGMLPQQSDYREIYSALNAFIGVRTYTDIPQARFYESMRFIAAWHPQWAAGSAAALEGAKMTNPRKHTSAVTGIVRTDAPQHVRAAQMSVISGHMAGLLNMHQVDLSDRAAVRVALETAGYGDGSIAVMLDRAVDRAGQDRRQVRVGGQRNG